MPHDKAGEPYEVLLNPLGVISRTNPAQLVEAALGKLAKHRGRPIKVEDFDENIEDMTEWAIEQLAKAGLSDTEDIIDPSNDTKIPGINTGYRFFMKLHHTAESKGQGRGSGGYTSEDTPAKGGETGSKRVSLLDVNALLSHGATEVVRDAAAVRGQKNEDYWLQFMQGHTPREPKIPLVYEKFVNELKGAGINVVRDGSQTHIMALTDDDVDELAGDRNVRTGATVSFGEELKPIPGGLFDPTTTGGHHGNRWSAIKLAEPMPNPVMEEPIRRVLGLTKNKFEDIIAGREELEGYGKGTTAIAEALDKMNLKREILLAQGQIKNGTKGDKDKAVRKLGYLKSAERLKLHPRQWMLKRAPVLPPQFRPVNVIGEKDIPLVADPNFLYKELIEANNNLVEMRGALGDDVGDERLAVYHAFRAVTGLGDPITQESKEKNVRGILKSVFGSSPKFGCFDDETEILTRRGWLRFKELEPTDEVMTLNPNTGYAEWQAIEQIHRYPYVGEMLQFRTKRALDMVVTPNHRNWIRKRSKSRSQDDMENGWEFEPAYHTAAARGRRWFRTAASGWKGKFSRPSFLSVSVATGDFAAFVGWWAAEGWLSDRDLSCVQICQAVHQKEYCDEIARVLASLDLGRVSEGDYEKKTPFGTVTARQWSLRSAELAAWLTEHVGRGAGNKKLSGKVKDWPTPMLEDLLLGYLRGDGGKRHKSRVDGGGVTHRNRSSLLSEHSSASTTSTLLADDLAEIACKLGLVVRKRVGREATVHEDGSIWNTLYKVNLDTSRFVTVEGGIESIVDYEGDVHCVSVDNGIVYVRRDGKPFFSGNSMQRKLISSTVDNVGRAVITPNPDLDMDSVGLPEDRAFEVYQRFLIRRLKRKGMSLTRAMRQVKDKTPLAREMLIEEMESRPVIINRAPVLHRYGIMAFKPRLTKGSTLQVSPLIVGGFNADFDGDAMNYHVPTDEEARKEALQRMLPSRQLLSPSDFKTPVHKPGQEYIGGLYEATRGESERPVRTFSSQEEAVAAYRRGEIRIDDRVQILD